MSSTFGIGNTVRCDALSPRTCAASVSQCSTVGLSPSAVATKQTRGARPVTPAKSIAYSVRALNSRRVRRPSRKPPLVARMVGASADMGQTYAGLLALAMTYLASGGLYSHD